MVTGKDFLAILDHAKANEYAIPAVNCTMSPISNACMEAAMKANAPMIVQFSNGGGYYNIGKGVPNDKEQKAAVAGTIAGALHVRAIAEVRTHRLACPLPPPERADLSVNCAPATRHRVMRHPHRHTRSRTTTLDHFLCVRTASGARYNGMMEEQCPLGVDKS